MVNMRWELAPWSEPWTGPANRRSSAFRSTWDATLSLLADETDRLDSGLVIIEIDIDESALTRNHQGLLSGREPTHSGVRVMFESKHGEQIFATAEFWRWRDNVRAVALSLEALRKVDTYGTTHGQQYVGFRPALPAGTDYKFASPKDAIKWLTATAEHFKVAAGTPSDVHRRLGLILHPDYDKQQEADPDGTLFLRLIAARDSLHDAGVM